ncbi:MAG TPA: FecR domain-containing protein, partial [Chitinophagaceae bacterium]|nr:FecR domain-containing protein [Chitinophagaceae bacterium]
MRNEIHMEIDTTLIGKYLAGEASPEEAIAIENWIAESQNNRQVFEQYQKTWNRFQPAAEYRQPDKDLVWQELETSLPGEKLVSDKSAVYFLKHYAFAAAISGLIILSGITWFILKGSHSSGSVLQKEIAANSGFIHDSLPDGTEVVVNNKSRLVYPEKFATAMRQVNLDGEAFFSVKPDASRPFFINIDGVSIKILGTSFNVRRNEALNEIEIQVRTGIVEMFNKEGSIIIHAGQTGIYSKTENRFAVKDAVDLNSFAYATHELF